MKNWCKGRDRDVFFFIFISKKIRSFVNEGYLV